MTARRRTASAKAPDQSPEIRPACAADPADIWPGFAQINRTGASLARDMLCELESANSDPHGVNVADNCTLANWPRQGRPFRNVVAEYGAMAQAAGPQALIGFYAVLSEFLSSTCQGSILP